jgi:hypothetical protein
MDGFHAPPPPPEREPPLPKKYGASGVFDYNEPSVAAQIVGAAGDSGVKLILNYIGSKFGILAPIAEISRKGTKVAVLLPVIVRDSSKTEAPKYTMDVGAAVDWNEGVEVKGVRTLFYQESAFFKEHLQPTTGPQMLAMGIVKPNRRG